MDTERLILGYEVMGSKVTPGNILMDIYHLTMKATGTPRIGVEVPCLHLALGAVGENEGDVLVNLMLNLWGLVHICSFLLPMSVIGVQGLGL